jgi:hypothetical protein
MEKRPRQLAACHATIGHLRRNEKAIVDAPSLPLIERRCSLLG